MTGSKNLLNVRSGNGRGFYYAKRICASLPLDYSRDTHNLIHFSTQHYTIIQLFIHHTHLFFPFRICTCQTSHIIVCIVYTLPICIFVYCSFVVCVLSCCCHSVGLWSFGHYNKFLLCVNIPGHKARSSSSSSKRISSHINWLIILRTHVKTTATKTIS